MISLGEVAKALGDRQQAEMYPEKALDNAAEIGSVQDMMKIVVHYSELLADMDDHERARELLDIAVRHPATPEEERGRARECLRQLGTMSGSGVTAEDRGRGPDRQLERVI